MSDLVPSINKECQEDKCFLCKSIYRKVKYQKVLFFVIYFFSGVSVCVNADMTGILAPPFYTDK